MWVTNNIDYVSYKVILCDLLWEKGPSREDGSMKQNQFLLWQCPMYFLQISLWVAILVSVYSHKHRADYTTVHYMVHTTCSLHIRNKKSLNDPFSHSWSVTFLVSAPTDNYDTVSFTCTEEGHLIWQQVKDCSSYWSLGDSRLSDMVCKPKTSETSIVLVDN